MKRVGLAFLLLLALITACGRRPSPVPSAAARLYAADCRVCHGPGGRGGVENPLLHRTIPALRSSEWAEPGAARVLARIIREGSLPDGPRPGVVMMPGWEKYLSPAALKSLVTYIRAGLPGPEPPPPSDAAGLYRTACLGCHGRSAERTLPTGRPPSFYLGPLLSGTLPPGTGAKADRSPMPALGRVLTPTELWSLVAYLQTGRDPAACRLPLVPKKRRLASPRKHGPTV